MKKITKKIRKSVSVKNSANKKNLQKYPQRCKAQLAELQKVRKLTSNLNFVGNLPRKDPHMV